MIRFLFRACGAVLLAAALAFLVADGNRSFLASRLTLTSVDQFLPSLAPLALAAVETAEPLRWVLPIWPLLGMLFSIPLCFALGAAGSILLLLGRPTRAQIGVVSR